jgi:hypothetical protein
VIRHHLAVAATHPATAHTATAVAVVAGTAAGLWLLATAGPLPLLAALWAVATLLPRRHPAAALEAARVVPQAPALGGAVAAGVVAPAPGRGAGAGAARPVAGSHFPRGSATGRHRTGGTQMPARRGHVVYATGRAAVRGAT